MTDGLKVVSVFQFSPESQQVLREATSGDVVCITRTEEFITRLGEADVVCSYWMPDNWRALAPHLRWLQCSGAGVDGLQPTGVLDSDSGVIVTTATGIHATTISEYVFGSMLMFNRNWPEMMRLQVRHIWPRSANWYNLSRRELMDQTLAIIGLGHIGRRVAHLGRAFGMRVLATRRSVSEGEQDPDVDQLYPMERLHDVLRESDYIVLAVPLTPETDKLIGEPELRVMRNNAYLVNVARGRVIDEAALIRALREGWIGGAGLDVATEEPLSSNSPLYTMPNVILTPHISGVSVHYDERLTKLFADNLRRYRAGETLRNRYEPQRGY
ncbi:MAG TPA: D-2-hydroxyacid dehydrogenase [Ktedonobacter sp.]|nr:D-2-hydroxyacid dehydrogenase [Ktedonobacter sp.]HAG98654.1 D-2-hydroxyacid dehydrogenase [Ktedonobacter sp.]HAT46055.1 D-2-hydroxyacid dehydrogenase [Ktedonobacter sp.]HBE26914.1 D-2-hydroxyacid dehydrogenase [Ktedonobacter sp.]HCF87281.1 D-2-hydroxyacid dehydrogenase [Ktedonobacter sp.]